MFEAYQASKTKRIRNWLGYLRGIAVRRGIDRIRQLNRKNALEIGQESERLEVQSVAGVTSVPEASIEMNELKNRLRMELLRLPNQQAEAFWLRFIEEMSYNEIALQMDIDSNLVGVLIHRARLHVRKALSDLKPNRTASKEMLK